DEKLRGEKEALGFFLTSHPLQPFRREIPRLGLTTLEDARDMFPGAEIKCALLVTGIKEITTKKGERMAFVSVEDLTGHAEMTVFPRTYAEHRELFASEQPLYVEARLDAAEERSDSEDGDVVREVKMLGGKVQLLADVCQRSDAPINITIPDTHCTRQRLLELRSILEAHPGANEARAIVLLDGHRCVLRVGPRLGVAPGPNLDKELSAWAQAR
ncbi:MAG: DNA polymerase III subunit alpha, partial [Desulfovibrionaceae bacterium]